MENNFDNEPLEELNSDGSGSGLETERSGNEPVKIDKHFDPRLIDVVTVQRTIDAIMQRLEHNEIDLSPDFQRRANLWNEKQKNSLIESMLLRIPIPSLYISEDRDGNYQVVDGLQRLTTIAHFVKVSSLNKALNAKLGEEDKSNQLDPLRLKKVFLTSLGDDFDGKTFDELPRTFQRRIEETELTLNIIRPGTPSNVKFTIFSRINQGGLPLTAQEIRNALYHGKWRDFVRKMAKDEVFLSVTEHKIKGERLEDHELILRFAALYSYEAKRPSNENLDTFLNNFVEDRCSKWDDEKWKVIERDFKKALKAAPRIFGRIAFRKYSEPNASRRPINRSLFEAETVILARYSENDLNKLEAQKDLVIKLFGEEFVNNRDFTISLLYATGTGWASNNRLEAMDAILKKAIDA